MEPPRGVWASLWSFLRFLPYFFGLLLLGIIKGALLCPCVFLIMSIGISGVVVGLWPAHVLWTYYCIIRTNLAGPVLKLVLCIAVSVILVLWLVIGIVGSALAGAVYGFLAPVMATFDAVGEGKEKPLIHCFVDGTWGTIKGSCTVVRDVKDLLFHSYFSIMDDLRLQCPPNGKPYEIRLLYLPGAFLVTLCGIIVDVPMISMIALYKSPVMLFKGWKRLIEDLIGREGPFLETACVPFAGLAILLWPLAVVGAVLVSIISSIAFGAFGAVVTYQESSIVMGFSYVISSLSIYDEYTNDVLDMREGSCFPRHQFRKSEGSDGNSLSRPNSFKTENEEANNSPSHTTSFKRATSFQNSFDELNPFKLFDYLFIECKQCGESLVAEGIITQKDIDETKSDKVGSGVLKVGLPAYVILLALLQSAKCNSDGFVLSDGTEITPENRPKHAIFDWFFEPLLIIKEQIKAKEFSEEEEDCLGKWVLLNGDSNRLKESLPHVLSLNERRRAEIDAFARRLQGITKSMLRYPTAKRRFDSLVKSLSEELERKMGGAPGNGSSDGSRIQKLKSGISRVLSQNSIGRATSIQGDDQEAAEAAINVRPV